MIELERHIEILLLDNDCVIVPGLGGFVTHHVEARYDEEDGTFLPPLRTLGFNPQLKLNDSLLAQSYVEAYDISYPEALRRIGEEVEALKQCLANEGSYELNDIGVLSLNEDGNYLFEPCEAGILTPELYGLGSFEMPSLAQKVAERPTKAVNAILLPPPTEEEAPKEEEKTISIKVSWLRNAVAVAAAIIAFFLITPPISNGVSPSSDAAAVQSAMFSQLMKHDAPNATATPALELKADTAKAKADSVVKAIAKAEETAKGKDTLETLEGEPSPYCIVMASHVAKAGAEAYVKKLHAEGYDQASVYTHNNIVRVVYGNYKSEAEAYNELRTVRGNEHFEQSWVYKKQ